MSEYSALNINTAERKNERNMKEKVMDGRGGYNKIYEDIRVVSSLPDQIVYGSN